MSTAPASPPAGGTNASSILGLIFGVTGVLLCWVPVIGLVCALVGMVLSLVGNRKGGGGVGTAGVVVSIIGVVVAFAMTACTIACSEASREASKAAQRGYEAPRAAQAEPAAEVPIQVVAVSAGELLTAYKENEVAADAKYKGKWVEVSGVVGSIKKGIMDSVYVTVEEPGSRYTFQSVQCHLIESETAKAAALAKGSRIKIRGKVDGLMMNVQVRQATIQ